MELGYFTPAIIKNLAKSAVLKIRERLTKLITTS
tara:strand:- start:1004 stop:1105 length:102 start_codon:yes stop_codon:yes gene_type:complete